MALEILPRIDNESKKSYLSFLTKTLNRNPLVRLRVLKPLNKHTMKKTKITISNNPLIIDENILKEAIEMWGVDAQVKMFREESLEVALAISKFYDRDSSRRQFNNLIDEIADATIMSRQMQFIPNWDKLIQKRINFKMKRLQKRLNK